MPATVSRRSKSLAVVAVAVHRQQHLGLDLGEAVDHRARAEVRRAARPHGADRRAGQERRDGLRHVGHVGDHPVAGPDAARPAGRRRCRRPRRRSSPQVMVSSSRSSEAWWIATARVVLAAEDVLGVGQPRAGEPLRAGHLARAQHALVGLRGAGPRRSPRSSPEALEVLDRPPPQRVVVGELHAALGLEPAHVARDGRALDALGGGGPQGRGRRCGAHRAPFRPRDGAVCSRSAVPRTGDTRTAGSSRR